MMGTSHSDGVSQAAGEQSKPTVLFVCVHNAGKSQMAAAIMRQFGGGLLDVRSAGTDPDAQVHDLSAVAVAELGADMSDQVPTRLVEPGYGPTTAFAANTDIKLEDVLPEPYGSYAAPILAGMAEPAMFTTEVDVAEAVWAAVHDASDQSHFPAGADALALVAA